MAPSRKDQATVLHLQGMTQRDIAAELGVTQTSVWRWLKGAAASEADTDELSVRQAAEKLEVPKDIILNAIKDERLKARWGARTIRQGHTGPREQWIILEADLERFVREAPRCAVARCDRPGLTRNGCCCRDHSLKMTAQKEWSAERIQAKRDEVTEAWRATGSPLTEGQVRRASGRVRQKYLGRWEGRKAGQGGGRPVGYTPEQQQAVRDLKERHPEFGRKTIALQTGLTENQIRTILSK